MLSLSVSVKEGQAGSTASLSCAQTMVGTWSMLLLMLTGAGFVGGGVDAQAALEPGPPTNVVVSNISSTALRLSWDAPANTGGSPITEYKLWTQTGGNRRGWDAGERLLSADYTVRRDGSYKYAKDFDIRTRYLPGLTRDTLYRFMISARNEVAYGAPSLETREVRTLAEKPSPPIDVVASDVTHTELTVSWTPSADNGGKDIQHYTVYQATGGGAYEQVATVPVCDPECSTRLMSLHSDHTYSFKVTATNEVGMSIDSQASPVVKTLTATPPGKPTQIQAVAVSNSWAKLIWTPPTVMGGFPILRYLIEYRLADAQFGTGLDVGPTTSYTLQHLEADQLYYIRIRAQNTNISLGFGEYGDVVVARTAPLEGTVPTEIVPAPTPPPTASRYGYAADEIYVNWKLPDATFGQPYLTYQVYYREIAWEHRGQLANSTWIPLVEIEAITRYHVYVGAKEGVAYQFAVSVRNVAGFGPMSPASNILGLNTEATSNPASPPAHMVDMTLDAEPKAVQTAIAAGEQDDVVLVNYKRDDNHGMNCKEMSKRQTYTGYVHDPHWGGNIKFVTVNFPRVFDIPPDIEQLIHVDEAKGRSFELTVHNIWTSKFTIKIRRLDENGGWNDVVVILWRAAAPSGYRCSVRGALMRQDDMRPGFTLRIVFITLEAEVDGDAMPIFRNVTFQTDPRLTVFDPVTKGSVQARAVIRGVQTRNGLFEVMETSVVFQDIELRDAHGGQGGALHVQDSTLLFTNCILAGHQGRNGGAIFLRSGSLQLIDTVVANNTALAELWDGQAWGGGIFVEAEARLSVHRCHLMNNLASAPKAHAFGGAIYTRGNVAVTETVFLQNQAMGKAHVADDTISHGNGGAIAVIDSGDLTVHRTHFDHNSASTSAGAVYSTGTIHLRDSTGQNNTAPMGSNVRTSLSSEFAYINCSFLDDDRSHYVESAELITQSGENVFLSDDVFLPSTRL